MDGPLSRRLVVVSLLLVALLGLCVWFGTLGAVPEYGAYPGTDDVGPTPEPYLEQSVTVDGLVVDTAPVRIRIDYGFDRSRIIVVTNLVNDIQLEHGDTLRVFGTLTDEETVRAANAFTVPAWGSSYTYSVSALAGLWVLARLLGQWRLDPAAGLVRRSSPLRPLDRLRNTDADTGGDDA
jgi:hypothetical protein